MGGGGTKDVLQPLALTELIQELTDDIRQQERHLKELESRGRISVVSAGVAFGLCLITYAIGSTATYIIFFWLAFASCSALIAFVTFKRRELINDLIGQNMFFRSVVIEEAYTGKDIGPQI